MVDRREENDEEIEVANEEVAVSTNNKNSETASRALNDSLAIDIDDDDLVNDDEPIDELLRLAPKVQPTAMLSDAISTTLPREIITTRNQVKLQTGGPLRVSGAIQVFDADGGLISEETDCALCRCGASLHKPFCDDSHVHDGLDDVGDINGQREEHQTILNPNASLQVRCRRDGPFIFQGPITLTSASGEHQLNREKVALCRCGASVNKPFCDGSHKALRFSAD